MTTRTFDVDLTPDAGLKGTSTFYPPARLARIRTNADGSEWGRAQRARLVAQAAPFLAMDDETLWSLMFGPALLRSWHVWSTGYCPACHRDVPMYSWGMDALAHPWKTQCPHCGELFPKNDFAAYHRSGLDARGVFDPARADRGLLFNTEHPDPADPLHAFAVDDGTGFQQDGHTWWFIGAYLIYGQWKRLLVGGAVCLANAYAVTGDTAYAHRAAILLDRIADLYPEFDFGPQAMCHDEPANTTGYVSIWHDACGETRALAMAYDVIFDALPGDAALVDFLAGKAAAHGLANPKATFADIQRNIEDRLLRHPLANRPKIQCNYPQTDYTVAVLLAILGWPAHRERVHALLDWLLYNATLVDGTTGEKGMTDYTAFTTATVGDVLAEFDRLDPDFLSGALERHPNLRGTFRFFSDARCLEHYYPQIGDATGFALRTPETGINFNSDQGTLDLHATPLRNYIFGPLGIAASLFTFMHRMTALTGDPSYAQAAVRAAGEATDALPFDLTADDSDAVHRDLLEVAAREGLAPRVGSINKEGFALAILRAGTGDDARAAWLHYDSGGMWHGHTDGMNLGLYAYGLDLMPDFGYPPLQFTGGYHSDPAGWYPMASAHNTVVVDGVQRVRYPKPPAHGACTLWRIGDGFQVVRASCPEMIEGVAMQHYARTVALVDIGPGAGYLLDVFRVVGGSEHVKFLHSTFATLDTNGLTLGPGEAYEHGMMRDFRTDPTPAPGWQADWTVIDRYGYLPAPRDIHLRYTDLTLDASVTTCEGWICPGDYNCSEQAWIPRVLVRRRGPAPLATTFVGIIEPYVDASAIAAIRRLPLTNDGKPAPNDSVAVEVTLAAGGKHLLIAQDGNASLTQPEWGVETAEAVALFKG
jgi:hypothetical protein